MQVDRVSITNKASKLVEELKNRHGEVIFHQSGGCCDGSAPMLLPKDDFYLDESDIHMGNVAGVDFYMNQAQYEYWKHTHLTVDVIKGRGSSFSLEIPEGYRFKIDSRLFTEEEQKHLST
jgi:uncharacterized protein (DUF779 family)